MVLGLASIALLVIRAALVGNVSRYRYPVDPPIAVLTRIALMNASRVMMSDGLRSVLTISTIWTPVL